MVDRGRKWVTSVIAMMLAALSAVLAATPVDIRYGGAPIWTAPIGLDTHATFPAESLLFDTQIRLTETGYDLYRRHATRIPAHMARANAPITFSVSPDKEALTVHAITLWRNGVPHDVTDAVIFNATPAAATAPAYAPTTVTGSVPGVEPGDVLDWSATWKVTSPDWPGHFYHEFFTDWAVPSLHDRTQIIVPKTRILTIRQRGGAPAPRIRETDSTRIYTWQRREIAPVAYTPATPADVFVFGSVSVSTADSWADVAAWGIEQYLVSTDFPQWMTHRLAQWRALPQTEAAHLAVRFVQDDIPYDDDRQGLSTHIARTPRETLVQGRGDCKDKALLLVSLLTALGIEAHVALTDMDEGLALPQRAPSVFAFDHAVVRITLDGAPIYVDPTRAGQGGVFPHIAPAAYGFALPLRDGAVLEAMARGSATPELTVVERFDVSNVAGKGLTLQTVTTRTGAEADAYRYQRGIASDEQLTAAFADYYGRLYTGMVPSGDMTITDDRDANRIVVAETYVIPAHRLTRDLLTAFPLSAEAARWDALTYLAGTRDQPLSLTGTTAAVHRIEIVGIRPSDLQIAPMHVAAEGLVLARAIDWQTQGVRVENRIAATADRLSPQAMTQFADALNAHQDGLLSEVDLSAAMPPLLAQMSGQGSAALSVEGVWP